MNSSTIITSGAPLGQIITGKEDEAKERKGAVGWSLLLFALRLCVVYSAFWQIWLLGPQISAALLFIALLIFSRKETWLCLFWLVLGTIVVFYVAPTLYWPMINGWSPDEIRPLELWALLVPIAPVGWTIWYLLDFRARKAITDRLFPGPIGARDPSWGPVGPGDQGLGEPTLAPEVIIQREVRVVVPNGRLKGRLPPDAAEFILTPDGSQRFPLEEVERFARQLPALGATYSGVWDKEMRHDAWRGLIDICSAVGIVTEPIQGRPTTVLAESGQEAVQLVRGLAVQWEDGNTALPHPTRLLQEENR